MRENTKERAFAVVDFQIKSMPRGQGRVHHLAKRTLRIESVE
jgi:hypothetical protein